MNKLFKIMAGGIIGASVLAGGVALAHGWNEEGQGRWGQAGMAGHGAGMFHQSPGGHWGQQHFASGMLRQGLRGAMHGGPGMMGFMGPGRLFHDEMQKARTEVLVELSGQTAEQIEQDLQTHSMRALLQKYDINLDKMQTSMHAKMVLIVQKTVDEGRITQAEANVIFTHKSTGPHGPKGKAGVTE